MPYIILIPTDSCTRSGGDSASPLSLRSGLIPPLHPLVARTCRALRPPLHFGSHYATAPARASLRCASWPPRRIYFGTTDFLVRETAAGSSPLRYTSGTVGRGLPPSPLQTNYGVRGLRSRERVSRERELPG